MLHLLKWYCLVQILCCCVGPQSMKFENYFSPGGRLKTYMPKGGSLAYQQGWNDGCDSGLGIFGHTFQKHFYRFKKDQRFYDKKFGDDRDLFHGKPITEKDKKEYNAGWSATYSWCRHIMLGIQQGGHQMRPAIGGQDSMMRLHGTHQIYELQSWGPAKSQETGWFANW